MIAGIIFGAACMLGAVIAWFGYLAFDSWSKR